jgi:hypothetical protein
MGRTTVLITLRGSKHPVLGASARRLILVYQAANSEEKQEYPGVGAGTLLQQRAYVGDPRLL